MTMAKHPLPCSVDGCDLPRKGRGYCGMHYQRLMRHGSLEKPKRKPPAPLMQRLMALIDKRPNGCWIPRLKPNEKGYVRVKTPGNHTYVHRVIYEHFKGSIPEELELDHLCRVPACCNPDHLEAVTHSVNMLRQPYSFVRARVSRENGKRAGASITACVHGHAYTPDNTGYHHEGRRYCRMCNRGEAREYQRRKREERRNAI